MTGRPPWTPKCGEYGRAHKHLLHSDAPDMGSGAARRDSPSPCDAGSAFGGDGGPLRRSSLLSSTRMTRTAAKMRWVESPDTVISVANVLEAAIVLARLDAPLLFKGDDFAQTDVKRA